MGRLSKRNILWVIPIGIIAIFWYFYGPQKDITDNEYITYVKNYFVEKSGQPLGKAFESSCENPYWVYFETQKGQDVVEFEGDCPINSKNTKVNVQFLVDRDMTKVRNGALLLDSVLQEETDRDEFIVQMTK
ncbi:MAG: glucosamine 6-phosphate synthetase [Lysinibacillus sp.]